MAPVDADLVEQACDAEARSAQRDQEQQRADVSRERVAEDDDGGSAR